MALALVLLVCPISACASESEPSKAEAHCEAYCAAREAEKCTGFTSTCMALCEALFIAASAERACEAEATAVEECKHSPAAVRVGCSAISRDDLEELCGAKFDALDACRED
jgi:hypothetical protein